jgi:hypothetical protein
MARCALVNAIANLFATPFVVMNGFPPKSSTTCNGLFLDSPENSLPPVSEQLTDAHGSTQSILRHASDS